MGGSAMNGHDASPTRVLLVGADGAGFVRVQNSLGRDSFGPFALVRESANEEVLRQCEEECFDVILLDVVMPGMDGFETCRKLKSLRTAQHIPVLFLTAVRSDTRSRIEAIQAGGEGFLAKPIDEAELIAQIRAMAKIKQANEFRRDEKIRLATLVAERTRELEDSRSAALKLLEELREENEARRKTEEALKQSEIFLHQIVENIPDMIFVKEIESLRFVGFNRASERLLGYSRNELLGKNDYDLFPREQADFFTAKDREVIAGGKLLEILEEKIDTKGNGERILHTKKLPILDANGAPQFLLGISEDITQRKRLEESLQLSEAINRMLIEEAPIGVGVLQGEGVVFVNPAFLEIFGYESQEEIIGRPIQDLISPDDRETVTRKIHSSLHSRKAPANLELRGLKKSGRHFDLSVWPRVINYRGNPAILVFCSDLTEQKTMIEQLRQAQKMEAVGTLAGGVAHDFNNLLQVVLGYAEFIQMNDKLEKADLKSLNAISAAATRGAELVQQLLTFCRKGHTKPRLLNLNHQVIQAQKLMERTLPKMIRIELSLDDELPVINADQVQVEQILMNLAINARDAMEQGAGTLSISAKAVSLEKELIPPHIRDKSPDYVMLSVSDTGCGMAQETLEHIFEPFFTTKDVGQGTGLGLSIVFGIVEQHGGFITCNSSLGNGSTFNVYFPAIQGEPEKDGQRRIVKTGGGSETILIADDEEDVLSLCQSILNRAGYKVLTALNGNEALEIYRKQRDDISLVILDKMMPIMGGIACLQQLLRINPDVRVVIATGFLSEQPDDSIRPGSVELIEKPYSVQALLHAVRKTLDGEEWSTD